MLELEEHQGSLAPKVVFRLPAQVFGADQQTPIFYNGALYGIRPGGELACLDPQGKVLWTSGPGRRFGLGPLVIADGKLYAMNDSGLLTMARATPESFQALGQARILEGQDAWGPLAIAGDRLIARDLTRLVCVDIGKKAEE